MTLMAMAMATRMRSCLSAITAARCFCPEPFARRTFRTACAAKNIARGGPSQSIRGEPSMPPVLQSRREAIRNAKPFSEFLTDSFNRQHDYLRISVTERCNLRCLYCMPEEGVPLSPPAHMLTTPEIFYLSSLFVHQGVTKIRLTGGEPTVRRDIVPLMQQIGSLRSSGLRELALTTNGISLHRKLDAMVEAGLTGVNLSLDTLDPFQFQIMTRRNGFSAVMKSIDRILEMNKLGANVKLKVNCVVMRGMNERDIIPFVEMGREKDIEVRFIEYMPFGGNKWSQGKMIGFQEMLDIIRVKYPGLTSVPGHKNDTSKTFAVPGFVGKVGFITSMTNDFCGTCNRLRITSDGNLKVCLHGNAEVSLRDLLRQDNQGKPIDEEAFERIKKIEMDRRDGLLNDATGAHWGSREQELLQVIGAAVKRKAEKHADMGDLENMQNRPMILIDHTSQPQPVHSKLYNTPILPPGYHFKSSQRPMLSQSWPSAFYIGATLTSSTTSIRAFSRSAIHNEKHEEEKPQNADTKLQAGFGVIRLLPKKGTSFIKEKQARLQAKREERKRKEREAKIQPRIRPELQVKLREPFLFTDMDLLKTLRTVEKQHRWQESQMLLGLSEEDPSFVKKCDFDHYYRLYWHIMTADITIDHKSKRARRTLSKLYKKIGREYQRHCVSDDFGAVKTMGEEQKKALRSGLRYHYGHNTPQRDYDKDIIFVHSEDSPFVPTHVIRTKIAELEARIALEKTYPRRHHPFPVQWFLDGPWIEYMDVHEQRLRFELQQNQKKESQATEDQVTNQWKENLEQMEVNLISFKKQLQRRLGIIVGQDSAEEKDLYEFTRAHEQGKRGDKASAAQKAKLELLAVDSLKAHVDALTKKRGERLVKLSSMQKTFTENGVRKDDKDRSASATHTIRAGGAGIGQIESDVATEVVLQKLKARQVALAQEREAKLKQLQAYKVSGDRRHLELDLANLLPKLQQPVSDVMTPEKPQPRVQWPRRASVASGTTPTETLKGYIPPSGFVQIDKDLTINVNAPAAELHSQVTALLDRLKHSYPRLSTLPYDVSTSKNPDTLSTWLKILVKRWQTRFDSWTRYKKDQSSQFSNTYFGNVQADEDIKAVLDQMVRDHELHFEAAQRMAARWQEVFDRRKVLMPKQDPDKKIDWEEWNSSGMGWLGVDRESEIARPKPMASKTTDSMNQHPGKSFLARSQIRHYSTSRYPSHNRFSNFRANALASTESSAMGATPSLPHLTTEGSAHMVSVSTKQHTLRTAIATGTVHFSNTIPLQLIRSNSIKKGDVLSVSRIAGIMAAKKCPDLIPLCHPIMLTHVGVELLPFDGSEAEGKHGGITVEAKVQCEGQTGVEMEALSSVMGAALTVVDMCKAVDKGMRIDGVRVVLKEGGRSGVWKDEGWESVMRS